MKGSIETLRSFVNSWECDENVHMNIQFYWKRFGEAAEIFHCLSGADQQRWKDRHVRYHGELSMATNTLMRTAVLRDSGQLIHLFENAESGELSATAVDTFANPANPVTGTTDAMPELATPRSLPMAELVPIDTHSQIEADQGLVSHRSVVTPMECDQTGRLLDQFYISRFSDSASHLWDHLGVGRKWMKQNDLGTVAVEMKATRHREVQVGAILQVFSWLDRVGAKTFTFRHQVSDLRTAEPLYSGMVTALLLDLTKRKSVALPEQLLKLG